MRYTELIVRKRRVRGVTRNERHKAGKAYVHQLMGQRRVKERMRQIVRDRPGDF